ncbi:hypothetical protein AYI70_g6231, partial [Smittium culicis]
MPIQS